MGKRLLTVASICLVVTVGTVVGQLPAVRAASPSSQQLLQSFVDAYNRHDASGVLALMDPNPNHRSHQMPFTYGDCDYARGQDALSNSPSAIRTWLRVAFAEDDQIHVDRVLQGPRAKWVIGYIGTRSNNVLTAMGLASDGDNMKAVLNKSQTAFVRIAMGSCRFFEQTVQPTAAMNARAMAQAFLDAYASHDLGRMSQLLASTVRYVDCARGSRSPVPATRKSTETWLRTLFRQGDRFVDPSLVGPGTAHPRRVAAIAQRTNASGSGRCAGTDRLSLVVQAIPNSYLEHRVLSVRVTSD